MVSASPSATAASSVPSRGWLAFAGILSTLVGIAAIAAPALFSVILTQILGVFCLVSGVVSLGLAIFGKDRPHRFLSGLSGIIRIAAGAALLFCAVAGVVVLTLVLAAVFLSEGIVCIFTSLRMRSNPAWFWLFLNGVVALVLGGMIYAKWPIDAAWVVGLLYGIQSVFSGVSMLMLAMVGRKAAGD